PVAWLSGQSVMSPFGGSTVPVRVAATAPLLPVLGGSGVLVDLESAVRGAGTGGADGTAQVWLSAAAPPSIVDSLRAAGLMVLGEDSVTGRQDRLEDRKSVV